LKPVANDSAIDRGTRAINTRTTRLVLVERA
jgi:hypothetical protein